MRKPVKLGISVLDKYVGSLKPGATILIEGSPETYPYLLLHRIGYQVSKAGAKTTYIIWGDSVEDYREAAINVGLNVVTLEREHLWKYFSVASLNELLNIALKEATKSSILIDATSMPLKLSLKEAIELKNIVGKSGTILAISITPHIVEEETLLLLEKLFDIVLELQVKILRDEVRYIMNIKKHKKFPKKGLLITYTIGAQGIKVEQLRKIPY